MERIIRKIQYLGKDASGPLDPFGGFQPREVKAVGSDAYSQHHAERLVANGSFCVAGEQEVGIPAEEPDESPEPPDPAANGEGETTAKAKKGK